LHKAALILTGMLALSVLNANRAFAQTPEERTIGVYLINIGKIELQTGSYDLDFYIWFASDRP